MSDYFFVKFYSKKTDGLSWLAACKNFNTEFTIFFEVKF